MFTQLVSNITKAKRYIPEVGTDFEWNQKLLTPNLFRMFELVCGRRFGVRAENTTIVQRDPIKGTQVIRVFHTWEALIVETEVNFRKIFNIRKNFSFFKDWLEGLVEIKIYVPVFSGGIPNMSSPYVFAVGVDSTSTKISASASGATLTVNHTVSGSNVAMVLAGGERASLSSATYNGTSLTAFTNSAYSVQNMRQAYLMSPTTGTNSLVGNFSNNWSTMHCTTFTGASGVTHGGNNGSASNQTSMSSASVTVASGELATDGITHGTTVIVGGSQTQLANTFNANGNGSSYRNSAGTYTLNWTAGAGSVWAGSVAVVSASGGGGGTYLPKIIQS